MAKANNTTIIELSHVIKKLSEEERTVLLYHLKLKQFQKEKNKTVANPAKGIKVATLEEIDTWKHEARKFAK